MTLPSSRIFPERVDLESFENISSYLAEYTYTLQSMYEDLAQGINGDIRGSALTQSRQWTPTLAGTSTAGTFTYTSQTGWAYRQGLLTDVWFDISWTGSGSAAGNLYIVLPYKVANSSDIPFSSALQTSTIAYGASKTVLSINAITNTFRGEIWSSGSGVATSNIAVAGAGRLIGHLRYLGVQNES